eukprot:TRINITY_DN47654_c0_g1_i1.p3 TRINITY_DN47654_c0_g1~~TRINITY_DN47654_c0_g1_i1.p3  ORF type:complete len:148 (+),score=5.45 TRINITY_DN47654_c0_g1_i1:177-620(+)
MADHRNPTLSILLRKRGKTRPVKIELFCAAQWDHADADTRLTRIRVDGRWNTQRGKYTFFSETGLLRVLRDQIGPVLGLPKRQPRACRPDLHVGTRVRRQLDDGSSELLRIVSDPIQAIDGRWYVVCAAGVSTIRTTPIAVEDLEVV